MTAARRPTTSTEEVPTVVTFRPAHPERRAHPEGPAHPERRARRPVVGPPSWRAVVAVVAAVLVGSASTATAPSGASPSQAQCGNTAANPSLTVDRPTVGVQETAVVTVTGRSYLLPPHVCGTDVFGGIYLFFGWVQPGDQWGPSAKSSTSTQGLFGTTYSYPGEGGGEQTRDDGTGTIRLISFTAGGESGTSTPFHMDGQGNWQSNLTVRGATYSYTDLRTGASNSVDCRVVQCGVFTIGAHGKASRTNERFTPINFVDAAGSPIVPSNPAAAADGGVTSPGGAVGNASGLGETSVADSDDADDVGGAGAAQGGAAAAGSSPSTTTPSDSDGASDEPSERVLDTRETASVQDFGVDGGRGAPAGLLVGAGVLLAVVAIAATVAIRTRARRKGAA